MLYSWWRLFMEVKAEIEPIRCEGDEKRLR